MPTEGSDKRTVHYHHGEHHQQPGILFRKPKVVSGPSLDPADVGPRVGEADVDEVPVTTPLSLNTVHGSNSHNGLRESR